MKNKKSQSPFYPYTSNNIHPGFSVDCVILGFHKKKIKILLNKFDFNNCWQLPGGFMLKNENADEAVRRNLATKIEMNNIYINQFHLFSDIERTKIEQNIEFIKDDIAKGRDATDSEKWFLQRFITLGYYALVKYDEVKFTPLNSMTMKWFDIKNLPSLYSDHVHIIDTALSSIKSGTSLLTVGYKLLPEIFMMSELRKMCEVLLDKNLDRRNFQRKILNTNILEQVENIKKSNSYNTPIYYQFMEKDKNIVCDSLMF